MGREIRRVPLDFQHPKYTEEDSPRGRDWIGHFIPLHNETYKTAIAEWIANHNLWEKGEYPKQKTGKYAKGCGSYAEYNGDAPEHAGYRPEYTGPATAWCVYETVSEGTPVTPVFATAQELIDYLAEHGATFDDCAWSRANAERFVNDTGWAPTMVVAGGKVMAGHEYDKGD